MLIYFENPGHEVMFSEMAKTSFQKLKYDLKYTNGFPSTNKSGFTGIIKCLQEQLGEHKGPSNQFTDW